MVYQCIDLFVSYQLFLSIIWHLTDNQDVSKSVVNNFIRTCVCISHAFLQTVFLLILNTCQGLPIYSPIIAYVCQSVCIANPYSKGHFIYTGLFSIHFQNDRHHLSQLSSQAPVSMPAGFQKAQKELPEANQEQGIPET